jgi:hypothetical protein
MSSGSNEAEEGESIARLQTLYEILLNTLSANAELRSESERRLLRLKKLNPQNLVRDRIIDKDRDDDRRTIGSFAKDLLLLINFQFSDDLRADSNGQASSQSERLAIKQQASIQLKSIVKNHWLMGMAQNRNKIVYVNGSESKGEEEDARELQKSNEVSESDKVFLREHVLLTMGSVKLDAKVRQQLEEAVKDIVRMDFPEKWPVRLLFVRF